uniref:Uncharacterized protein n=1 Tax=Tanacetum cinerariifolium TaxID=118510 RepID=A0A6L2NXC2_TANCI|nr:hypothetical protein [Tanacetum cinerariifolium]
MANETNKNCASGSAVVDENQGRHDARKTPKKRGTSKDVVASLDKRVAGVEKSVAELKTQVEGLKGLDFDFTNICSWAKITKIREEFGGEIFRIHQIIEDLRADVALCKRSLASGGGNTSQHGLKLDFPNHRRSWESEKRWRLIISCGR